MLKSGANKLDGGEKSSKSNVEQEKKQSYTNQAAPHLPVNNGSWSGEKGNSTWKPDKDVIPKKNNPENKTFGEIMRDNGIEEGIVFVDDEPRFDEISKGNVEIEGFCEKRYANFTKADEALAKKRGCTPTEVRAWRKENKYTWHEKKTYEMQKVPAVVQNNIIHSGGISEFKNKV